MKYNILWIDDQLSTELKPVYEQAKEDYSEVFNIVGVNDHIEFEAKFNECLWDAVIFDINTVRDINDKNCESDDYLALLMLLCKERIDEYRIPIYAFSGIPDNKGNYKKINIEAELQYYGFQKHPRTNKYYWDKSPKGEEQIDTIFEDIKTQLTSNYKYYLGGKEYLLDFFKNGWLPIEAKTERMDPLLKQYFEKDYDRSQGNDMRLLTEKMMEKINEVFNFAVKVNDQSFVRNVAECIKKPGSNVPLKDFIYGPLLHMYGLSNSGSHGLKNFDERILLFESDFSAFFYLTYWFNQIMCLQAINNVQKGVETTKDSTQILENNKPFSQKNVKAEDGFKTSIKVPVKNGVCTIQIKNLKGYKNTPYANITGVTARSGKNGYKFFVAYCQDKDA